MKREALSLRKTRASHESYNAQIEGHSVVALIVNTELVLTLNGEAYLSHRLKSKSRDHGLVGAVSATSVLTYKRSPTLGAFTPALNKSAR